MGEKTAGIKKPESVRLFARFKQSASRIQEEIKCIVFFTGRIVPHEICVATDKACLIAAFAVNSEAIETDPAFAI